MLTLRESGKLTGNLALDFFCWSCFMAHVQQSSEKCGRSVKYRRESSAILEKFDSWKSCRES